MSDQTLRDALIEHIARRHWEHGQGGQWDRPADAPDGPFPAYATDQEKGQYRAYARQLVEGFDAAAHPAEPAPDRQPSNAAVQAAATAMQPTAGNHQVNCPTYSLRPFDECTCGIRANALFRARFALEAAYRVDAPQPLLDREAAQRRLSKFFGGYSDDHYRMAIDAAVMELARPKPTQEQIEQALDSVFDTHIDGPVPVQKLAAAVLALLNGAES